MQTLDEASVEILRCLLEDARISARGIAARVGLSAPAVLDRIRRMEDRGLIKGYKADIDTALLGRPISAFIRLTARDGLCEETIAAVSAADEVTEAHHVTGDTDYLLRVAVADMVELERLVTRLSQVGAVSTEIILATPIRRDPALPNRTEPAEDGRGDTANMRQAGVEAKHR